MSGVLKPKSPFNMLDPQIHPVQPIGHAGILVFEVPDPLLQFADILAHMVESAANVAQMLQHEVLDIGHTRSYHKAASL